MIGVPSRSLRGGAVDEIAAFLSKALVSGGIRSECVQRTWSEEGALWDARLTSEVDDPFVYLVHLGRDLAPDSPYPVGPPLESCQ